MMTTTKAQDDKAYASLLRDIRKAEAKLRGEQLCENFGQNEVRALRDKYSGYMSGNWSVCGRFIESVNRFDSWCSNYCGE